MAVLGKYADERSSDDRNNFLILRLVAASLVIHGHAFAIAAPCKSCKDIVTRYVGYRYSGDVGLHVFFVISGFLVFASYAKRRHLGDFLRARLVRIVPAFWICLALTVVGCAAFSTLPLSEYLQAPATRWYIVSNGLFDRAVFDLPGVKLTASSKYGAVVNGSIWSLFVEVRLYFMVALLGATGYLNSRTAANICLAVLTCIGVFWPDRLPFIGDYSENWRLAGFFGAGVFLYVNRSDIPLTGQIAVLLLVASILARNTADFECVAGACLAYGTFYLAYSRKLVLPKLVQDYSYGIYIYGWPSEQLIGHAWPTMGPYMMTATALCASWGCGFLSWHLVEKRLLRLKSNTNLKKMSKPDAVGVRTSA